MAGKKPSRSSTGKEAPWGLEEIEQLIDLLIDRQVTEFEMEQNGAKIRVQRRPYVASSYTAGDGYPKEDASLPPPPPKAFVPAPERHAEPETLPSEAPAETSEDLFVVKSPIVGTFYAAAAPNAPPFVQVGEVVQVGQVLCIIEAMKLMNELESEVAGEVVRSYVESGQPVEYGQSLFAIRPSHAK
jgi:acetyl-CoA carboxylase biotin carboxyl carrier protein